MKEDSYQLLVEDYLDKTLTPKRRREFEDHLGVCSSCRAELALCRRIERLARVARPVSMPSGLDEAIRHRLRSSPGFGPAGGGRLLPLFAGAAAAAALFVLVLSGPSPGPGSIGTPGPVRVARPGARPAVAVARVASGAGRRVRPAPPLDRVLSDWLVQAENAGPEEASALAAEARRSGLLGRVRSALRTAGPRDRDWLVRSEDLLVQLENDPGPRFLGEEARLVAKGRNR